MNRINWFILLILGFLFFDCNQSEEPENKGNPIIEFGETDFDFGSILMGEKVIHRFLFKNKGNGNLQITNVKSDCGCTIVDYKHESILPGEESYIEVEFDSNGLPGFQIKKILVNSNVADTTIILTVSAMVEYNLEKVN